MAPKPEITVPSLTPGPGANGEPRRHWVRRLRNYLIAGLLIWIPVMVTVWVVRFVSGVLDQSIVLLPPSWRPEALFGQYVPGFGIVLALLVLLLTGLLARDLLGERLVEGVEALIRKIPVIGPVYGGAKTFSETVLTDKGRSFKQVVMVEFPRKGAWSIGFLMSEDWQEVRERTGQDMVQVFVPTTPNPTTGFLIVVHRSEVMYMDTSVDEAFKMIFTLGVIPPSPRAPAGESPNLAPQQPPP
ncbi:MAG TPA: DUF502 domain-containing protein [Steroidobacteraceae bacterium]|nr:DUF502 domain-containing protein [Steroidobacteraceae bacterium]